MGFWRIYDRLWHDINDSGLMTRHSTNDTELFRKMTSLIFMDKISPFGHCHMFNVFFASWTFKGTYKNSFWRKTIYLYRMFKVFFSAWKSKETHDNTLNKVAIVMRCTISLKSFIMILVPVSCILVETNSDVSAFTQLSFPTEHFPIEMFCSGNAMS